MKGHVIISKGRSLSGPYGTRAHIGYRHKWHTHHYFLVLDSFLLFYLFRTCIILYYRPPPILPIPSTDPLPLLATRSQTTEPHIHTPAPAMQVPMRMRGEFSCRAGVLILYQCCHLTRICFWGALMQRGNRPLSVVPSTSVCAILRHQGQLVKPSSTI